MNKKPFSKYSSRSELYAFFNSGSVYLFNPYKLVAPDNTVQMTNLEFHLQLAKAFNSPSTFVLDSRGNEVVL